MNQEKENTAYESLQQLIKAKRENYERSKENKMSFYELRKLESEIISLEKERDVVAKNLNKGS